MDGPIASAVVLPEELLAPASPASNKRRQSSVSEDNAKRPRLDGDEEAKDRRGSINGTKPVLPVRRERGRERRLFGAALGALSQNSATVAQKRRSEIEKRQQAQRQREDMEGEQRKAERAAKRKEQRWREQKHFEVDSMRTRHKNLLSTAHFLQTEAEPHLYYKPWETTSEEEDRIKNQIAKAQDIIKQEIEENEARQDNLQERDATGRFSRNVDDSQSGKDSNDNAPLEPHATNGGTNGSACSPKDLEMNDDPAHESGAEGVNNTHAAESVDDSNIPSHESLADQSSKDDDDNGEDVVEEAAEDTVIY